MVYVVLGMLNELRPVWYFILAAVLFVLSQLDFFLLSKVICKVRLLSLYPRFPTPTSLRLPSLHQTRSISVHRSHRSLSLTFAPCIPGVNAHADPHTDIHLFQAASPSKVDGSFIATILETAAVAVLYLAWRSITEGAFLRSLSSKAPALPLPLLFTFALPTTARRCKARPPRLTSYRTVSIPRHLPFCTLYITMCSHASDVAAPLPSCPPWLVSITLY